MITDIVFNDAPKAKILAMRASAELNERGVNGCGLEGVYLAHC